MIRPRRAIPGGKNAPLGIGGPHASGPDSGARLRPQGSNRRRRRARRRTDGHAHAYPPLGAGGEEAVPPGGYNVELELTYLLVATAGTDQSVTFTATIPITPGLSSTNLTGTGEGEILEDVPFTIGPVTTHNVADWIIEVTASLDPAGGQEPLTLDFTFTGRGYSSVQEVQVGAHMDTGGLTYTHSLSLPLEDGATESFDVEGWTDILEWTVVLHLK